METEVTHEVKKAPSIGSILMTVGPFVLSLILAITTLYYRDRVEDVESDLAGSVFRSQSLNDEINRLNSMIKGMEQPEMQIKPTFTSTEVESLNRRGFKRPYLELAHDLAGNPTLMTPAGYEVQNVSIETWEDTCILGPDRALARYRQGDLRGKMLLSYAISDQNEITWKILEKWPDPQG